MAESFVLSLCLYVVLTQIFSLFGFSGGTISLTVSALFFLLFSLLFQVYSPEEELGKRINFLLSRRRLKYRELRKRLTLKKKSGRMEKYLSGEAKDRQIVIKDLCPGKLLPALAKSDEVYTQERLGIKGIYRDILECEGNRFVKIVEVKAGNFNTLSQADKETILLDFSRLLDRGPVTGRLKVISKRSDLRSYITHFKERVSSEDNPTLKRLAQEIINQCKDLESYTALDHRYLVIFEEKALNDTDEARREALESLEIYTQKLINTLGRHGCGIVTPENPTLFTLNLLFEFYNRNPGREEDIFKRNEHLMQVKSAIGDSLESLTPASLIAPREFDFRNRDVIVIDGVYYAFLVISDFPQAGVDPAFLNFFTNVGEGFDFDLIYRRELKRKIREELKKRNLYTQTNADQMNAYSTLLSRTRKLIASNGILQEKLEGDCEFFYFLLICTVSADSYRECIDKRNWLKDHFETYNFSVNPVQYNLEEVYELTELPGKNSNRFFERHKRNVLTDGLKNFYPFTSASTNQDDGILIGVDKNNLSPVILDLFNPMMNSLIIGATGFGKSYLTMMLATRLRLSGTQVFIVTPIKGHEYRLICEELGGTFVELGPGSKDSVNILEVRPVCRVNVFSESEVFTEETSFLSEKIEELTAFFNLIAENNLPRAAKHLLPTFLIDFYYDFGITEDNSSIYVEGTKTLKPMPTFSDLKEALEDESEPALRELALLLEKFTDGNLKSFNRQTNVDLSNPLCVIDLSRAIEYEDTRKLVNYIVQNFVWSRIRSDRTQRKAVFYEEIWKFLDNPETARTIREVFKTIRGYYGIAVGITQNLEDLTESSFGGADGIINNALLQFIFRSSSDEAEKLAERFRLGSSDYNFITGSQKGEVLIISPREHVETQVLSTAREGRLYETDGKKL